MQANPTEALKPRPAILVYGLDPSMVRSSEHCNTWLENLLKNPVKGSP